MTKSYRADEAAPAKVYKNITKSDSTTYSGVRGVYVGGIGDLVTEDNEGNVTTHKAVPVGTELRICPVKVLNATTATEIVLYF